MRYIYVLTDNAFKFAEISDMLALYGCKAILKSYDFQWSEEQHINLLKADRLEQASPRKNINPSFVDPIPSAFIREETSLVTLQSGLVEHQSRVMVIYPPTEIPEADENSTPVTALPADPSLSGAFALNPIQASSSSPSEASSFAPHSKASFDELMAQMPSHWPREEWVERVKGTLNTSNPLSDEAYHWDTQFTPQGSQLTLHELKGQGLKVSARQKAVGAWIEHWLHYDQPVSWKHMTASDDISQWLEEQPLLNHPATADTRALILRTHRGGAWFKASTNRRIKHYWWPGLNAGIPMTPKSDYVHELTFLIHDLVHWTMPDVLLTGNSPQDYRLYLVTRMMSEAITLVHADMLFIHQALQAGLDYNVSKRQIYPLYNPQHSARQWCHAMSHFAILGDDSRLKELSSTPEALAQFKLKYSVFFEEDLRWTAHNASHLSTAIHPDWAALFTTFAKQCDLHLHTTRDYHSAWSDEDETLVNQVFDLLWARQWEAPQLIYTSETLPETRRLQRWWLGQLSLTYHMNDLPLSKCVRDAIVSTCLATDLAPEAHAQALQNLIPLWDNYIDALEGLSRLSSHDMTLAKSYYPIVPPMYVSYDQDRSTYQGIATRWHQHKNPPAVEEKTHAAFLHSLETRTTPS